MDPTTFYYSHCLPTVLREFVLTDLISDLKKGLLLLSDDEEGQGLLLEDEKDKKKVENFQQIKRLLAYLEDVKTELEGFDPDNGDKPKFKLNPVSIPDSDKVSYPTDNTKSNNQPSSYEAQVLSLQSSILDKVLEMRGMQRSIQTFDVHSEGESRTNLCRINQLKDQIHTAKKEGESNVAFVETWLTARNTFDETGIQKEELKERRFGRLKKMEETLDRDCTAYENVIAFTKLTSLQTDRRIESWKEKLTKDMDSIQKEIEEKRKFLAGQREVIDVLEKSIEERVEELIPWEEEKEQERLERLQHMRRYYSCRKLQRWWRKCMIHYGLYMKQKKAKAKAKAKSTKEKMKNVVKVEKPSKPLVPKKK